MSFARGALYHLLRNRLYLGEIRHRDQWYPGEHEGIVPPELWDRVQAQLSTNLRTRRHRLREQSSSLLTGLLEDADGNRFTPSFTVKKGKRYPYYVSQLAIKRPGSQSGRPIRMPAHEIERRVTERLHSFLQSDAEVFDELSAVGESPATIRPLVGGAKKLAAKWSALRAAELKSLLGSFLRRVIVHENNIQVVISRNGLRQVLAGGDAPTPFLNQGLRQSVDENDVIRLTIEAKLKRLGGEVHLVVPPNSFASSSAAQPRPSLVKAIARAHGWYQQVLEGKAFDQRSLARHAGLTERYVGKVLACAFLAPDIIEAILEGRQPRDLNFEKLCQHIPLSWTEQRAHFGFPPVSSH